MGMFDSVIAACPRCGDDVEFQSKAGDRYLRRYPAREVPPAIAVDIDNQVSRCPNGHAVRIVSDFPVPKTVRMTVYRDPR